MKKIFDQLNLRPQERRVLVVVLFLVFVVLNWMFVRPLFGQFGVAQDELAKAQRTQKKYEDEIAKEKSYRALETKLKESGSQVLNEELQLQRIIDQHATAAGVAISRYAPGVRLTGGRTNQFFEDQGLTVDFNTYSTNLVEFLVAMASGNSMIRVQEMNLKPDPSGTRLSGSLLFIASYQKKAPPRAVLTPAPKANASTTTPKPAATTTNPAKTNAPGNRPIPAPNSKPISTNKASKK